MANESGSNSSTSAAQFSIVPQFVWQGCQPSEVKVYCALASRVDWTTGVCWPSHQTIANDSGVSTSTVKRALKTLVAIGAVEVEHRRDPAGDLTTNLYRLPFAINRRGGGVTSEPTSGHGRPRGGVTSDLQNKTHLTREGLTQPKNDPDACQHLPVDPEGYCTACGTEVT